jgi:intein/homing endonuclease
MKEPKRVYFKSGKQKQFISHCKFKISLSWSQFEEVTQIKNLKSNYWQEKASLPLEVFVKLCKLINTNQILILKKYYGQIQDQKIPKRTDFGSGRINITEKRLFLKQENVPLPYCSILRSCSDKKKKIRFPKVLSTELAEEIGIHLGDGFLSNKKYDFRVKGHKIDEREYYDKHLKKLYFKLYNINLSLKEYKDTYGFELYSKGLWYFKTKTLGIKPGRKTDISAPLIILNSGLKYKAAFLRGLFDTDGCVHFYSKSRKFAHYPQIMIAQKSSILIMQVAKLLRELNFLPREYHYQQYSLISINGYAQLKHFQEIIGWNNVKHIKKVAKWKEDMATVVYRFASMPVEHGEGVQLPPVAPFF